MVKHTAVWRPVWSEMGGYRKKRIVKMTREQPERAEKRGRRRCRRRRRWCRNIIPCKIWTPINSCVFFLVMLMSWESRERRRNVCRERNGEWKWCLNEDSHNSDYLICRHNKNLKTRTRGLCCDTNIYIYTHTYVC